MCLRGKRSRWRSAGDAGGIRIVASVKGSNESEKGPGARPRNARAKERKKERRKVKAHPHAAPRPRNFQSVKSTAQQRGVWQSPRIYEPRRWRFSPILFSFFLFVTTVPVDCAKIACGAAWIIGRDASQRRIGRNRFHFRVSRFRLRRVTQCDVAYYPGTGCNCTGSVDKGKKKKRRKRGEKKKERKKRSLFKQACVDLQKSVALGVAALRNTVQLQRSN